MHSKFVAALVLAAGLWTAGVATADVRIGHQFVDGGSSAVVKIPRGVDVLTWQRYDRTAKVWVDEGHVDNFQTGVRTRIAAPAARAATRKNTVRWRLMGRKVASENFPDSYYRGSNQFPDLEEDLSNSGFEPGWAYMAAPLSGVDLVRDDAEPAEPLESDIWKVDGSTIYYFNELRGLQIIDAANPSEPVVTSALRLPAQGQDLYVLPEGNSASRNLALITHATQGQTGTRVLAVGVHAGAADLLGELDLEGWPVDSRLIAGRLYITTQSWISSSSNWNPEVTLSEIDLSGATPVLVHSVTIPGSSPVMAAGPDWLVVATSRSYGAGGSEVRVFGAGSGGLVERQPSPLIVSGSIGDSYKLSVRGEILSVISQSSQEGWNQRVTVLENFRLGAGAGNVPLGRLELARGESLFATRFDGDTAYIVTFEQIDPLWVVDLRNAAEPVVAGHLEVPGWSTHLVPLGGGKLFAVGFEDGKVSTSLFDVSDPANPLLLGRVNIGEGGSWSEATWDEKALNVLPSAGIALLPFSTWENGESHDAVQILQIDAAAGTLDAAGVIDHAFVPRRAAPLGKNLASISGRELTIVDAVDPDAPEVVSSVMLAWPVNRILLAGERLLQIEDGQSWSSEGAVLRVSPVEDTEQIEGEISLGAGRVLADAVKGDVLCVLRDTSPQHFYYYRMPGVPVDPEDQGLFFETYSLAGLPDVSLLSSVEIPSPAQTVDTAEFASPSANSVVALLRNTPLYHWFSPMPIDILPIPNSVPAAASESLTVSSGAGFSLAQFIFRPYPITLPTISAALMPIDITNPAAPVVGALHPIDQVASLSRLFATDNLVAIGMGVRETTPATASRAPGGSRVGYRFSVYDVAPGGSLTARPLVDLPGRLQAVTEFNSTGALLWTLRNAAPSTAEARLDVCAWDGSDAYLTASMDLPNQVFAAKNRTAYGTSGNAVSSHTLDDSGQFIEGPSWELGVPPEALSVAGSTLLASSGFQLFATSNFQQTGLEWLSPVAVPDLDRLAGDGPWFLPTDDYGIEVFRP